MASVVQETGDTWTLGLDPGDGGFPFQPGQFTMLYRLGVGEAPISISGDPACPQRLVHTIRAVGPATRALCAVEVGEQLGVRGPFGRGWPLAHDERCDLVLIAGGLGLAPLRPALYGALADRDRFGRLILLYGSRDPSAQLFEDELAEWQAADSLEVMVTVDIAAAGWRGRVGVVPDLIRRAELDPDRTVALTCGPELMMRFTVDALLDAGVGAERVFVSLERNMRCAIGHCGHCQLGGNFLCRDGPVFAWPQVASHLRVREL